MGVNLLSIAGWSNLAFWTQVVAWVCGFLVLGCGVTSYWAKSQATFLKEQEAKTRAESDKKASGPRRLDALQEQKIGFVVKEAGLSILLIAVNDAEAKATQFR